MDLFPAVGGAAGAPTLVAIHGGLWFLFDRSMMHFLVPAFTAAGINVVTPGYRLAPEHSLSEVVGDCLDAVSFLQANAAELSVDAERIGVIGHSAAGQLAAVVASTERFSSAGPAHPSVRALIGVSGFYEIEPFGLTDFQPLVGFTAEDYERWNPLNLVSPGAPESLLITGGEESNWLHEMCATYAQALGDAGATVTSIDAEGETHFSVLSRLGDPESDSHRAVLALLRGP
jgi:arylformamidase